MFLNIHTHIAPEGKQNAIQNLYEKFECVQLPGKYSIGLHPWYIDSIKWKQQFEILKSIVSNKNVLAIGECGLDKICNTDFKLQQTVFTEQIKLAVGVNKPIIIHCVKAWQEVFDLLKVHRKNVPVVFHGFNKNIVLAKQVIDKGYYISFGKAIQTEVNQKVFATLPLNRIFFETDDAAIPIESIYKTAATVSGIDIKSLCLQIQKNAVSVFGTDLTRI